MYWYRANIYRSKNNEINMKRKMFIGSSSEGLSIARIIKKEIDGVKKR